MPAGLHPAPPCRRDPPGRHLGPSACAVAPTGARHGDHHRFAVREAVAHEVGGAGDELVDVPGRPRPRGGTRRRRDGSCAPASSGRVRLACGWPDDRSPSDEQPRYSRPRGVHPIPSRRWSPPPGAPAGRADTSRLRASRCRASSTIPPQHPHPGCHIRRRRRCSDGVDVIGPGVQAPVVALPVPLIAVRRGAGRVERRDGTHVGAARGHGAVRADLEQVFRATYPRVVAVAARVLGSQDEAEDVAQEVFVAFGRTSVPAEEARGWLAVAAAHTALNHLRTGPPAQHPRGGRPRRAGRARRGRHRPRPRRAAPVRAALARLPQRQAVALVLRHSGLSYAEVAAALDLSPGSVGTTVRRAENALREEMDRHASSH